MARAFVRSVTLSLASAGLLAVTGPVHALGAPVPDQAPNQRTAIISVLGRGDLPVADLTVKDFTVREDGTNREVVAIAPAPPPATLVLLIDDSQAAVPLVRDLRQALTGFANTFADESPAPAVRLSTFGDRPTVRSDFNASFSSVSRAIDRIAPASGSGSTFIDAIIETCRDLRTRKLPNAVIVAFVVESGPEFSNATHTQVAAALKSARASLWTIVLQTPGGADTSNPELRERSAVVGDVTQESGGRNKFVLAAQNLPRALAEVAGQVLSRYALTYGRPDSLIPPTRLEISPRDRTWSVQVPRWPAE